MFGSDRNELRKVFYDSWQRYQRGEALDALQQVIVNIIVEHPEYHGLLQSIENVEHDFDPAAGETNPFLHMSMHIALHEQVSTDRPPGIRELHHELVRQFGDLHHAEHRMMDCLADALWLAQQHRRMPDEAAYFECLKKLLEN
jgi:hypothetical protein